MRPAEFQQALSQLVSGEIADSDLERLYRHISDSPSAQEDLSRHLVMDACLNMELGRVRPSSGMVEAILERIDAGAESRFDSVADLVDQESLPKCSARRSHVRKRRRKGVLIRYVLPPLAAAAAIVLVLNFFELIDFSHRTQADYRVLKRTGHVQVRQNVFATGSDSYCLLKCTDETVLALDQNTKVALSRNPETRGEIVEHRQGRLYVDVTQRETPFVVRSGISRIEALGTKFTVSRAEDTIVHVMDGVVGVTRDKHGAQPEQSIVLRKGQRVLPYRIESGTWLKVETVSMDRHDLLWLAELAVAVPVPEQPAIRPVESNFIDFDNYLTSGGVWNVEKTEKDVVIRQERPGDGWLFFGSPMWNKGEIYFEFKVLKDAGKPGVHLVFFDDRLAGPSFGWANAMKRLRKKRDGWINTKVLFERTARDVMVVKEWVMWIQGDPSVRQAGSNWAIKGGGKRWAEKSGPFGIGLGTTDCSAEFRNVKLLQAEIPPGTTLFEDDFEGGLGKWKVGVGDCKIVEGKGVGKSRCMLVCGTTSEGMAILPNLVPRCRDFEVSYKAYFSGNVQFRYGVEFQAPEGGENVAVQFRQGSIVSRARMGQWLHHRFIVRGLYVRSLCFHKGKLLYDKKGRIRGPFVNPMLVCSKLTDKDTFYVDDVMITKLGEQED